MSLLSQREPYAGRAFRRNDIRGGGMTDLEEN